MIFVRRMLYSIALVALGSSAMPALADGAPPVFEGRIEKVFEAFDARQAVAVDAEHFYAVNNFRITRHDKVTGAPQLQWDGVSADAGPLIHLDSAMIFEGKLFAAHSNYPQWPMASSIEVWDTATMAHVDSHSFGIQLGSMTWIDRHDGFWWGGFGNYDIVQWGMIKPYGETRMSQIVKMDDQFQIVEQWALPAALRPKMSPMSNSGGSWGVDGFLYLTGHDYPELYVMRIPATGGTLEWIATVHIPGLNGQGIAWDRTVQDRVLWSILREGEEVLRIAMPVLVLPQPKAPGSIRGAGDFAQ